MESDWRQLAKKAKSNLKIADAIVDEDPGEAMFHAQQAVELAAKACVFKYSLHHYIIKKELRKELFVWESSDESVRDALLPYLQKVVGLTWITPKARLVKKTNLINIQDNGKYLNLIPRRTSGTIAVTLDRKVVHELYFESENKKRKVFSEDRTFRSHDPLTKLLDEAHQFTKSRLEGTRLIDDGFTALARQMLKVLGDMVALMKKMEKDEELLVAMWKKSLGIDSDNQELKNFLRNLRIIDESGIINDFAIRCNDFIRSAVLTLFKKIKSARRSLAIKYRILPDVRDILKGYDLPASLVDAYVGNDPKEYDAEINEFVSKHGGIRILNIIFRPNGILEALSAIDKDLKTIEFKKTTNRIMEFAKRYSWLSHIAAISSVMLLMYPHVSIGRYPRLIGASESDAMYLEHLPAVRTRIKDCRGACENLQHLLEYRFVSDDISEKK